MAQPRAAPKPTNLNDGFADIPPTLRAWTAIAVAELLNLDQFRSAQGRGFGLQRFVVGIGAVLVQDLELADGDFVVGGG